LKIVHVSTFDTQGGAARASYRLHLGLQRLGQESLIIARYKMSTDDSVLGIASESTVEARRKAFLLERVAQPYFVDKHLSGFGNTIFSLPYPGYDLSALPQIQAADIINLHWIAYYQSPITLHNLLAIGKPVIWTLHDQWPFTGGCHYTAGCEKFRQDCVGCPQLTNDAYDLPAAVLKDREAYSTAANLTIVAPSRWLAACASESQLFRLLRVEVIPYSLDTDLFRPIPKPEAKAKLGLAADTVALLFGAQDGMEKRKGFHVLLAAVRHCLSDPHFQQLVTNGRIRVLCFGYPPNDLVTMGIPTISLGQLNSDEDVRVAYSAADVFILPSLEDNLPNTMLEAMSCGTPVIGSNIGGISDVISDGITGYLVPPGDAQYLGESILSTILNPGQLVKMGQSCRSLIEYDYKLEVQASAYLDLYKELCPADGETQQMAKGGPNFAQGTGRSAATLPNPNAEIGENFARIYEPILFEALQEFAPAVYEKWKASEADHAESMRFIVERDEVRHKLEEQTQQTATPEAERARLLRILEEQSQRLGSMEVGIDRLQQTVEEQAQRLDTIETERADLLQKFEVRGRQIGEIEAARDSLRADLDQTRQQLLQNEALNSLQAVTVEAQRWQIQTAVTHFQLLYRLLQTIQSGRVYKIARKLGGWKWVEEAVRDAGNVSVLADTFQADSRPQIQSLLQDLPKPPLNKSGWPWTETGAAFSKAMPDGSPWPRISIITPSYNQGKFIEETIRSVLLQGYPNLEYIIIDGGSTDESVEIIRKYSPWLTYWESEKDRGQSHAINKGWTHASGKIWAWLNSDDLYLPDTLLKIAEHFRRDPYIQVLYGSALFVDENGQFKFKYEGHPLRPGVLRMQYWLGWDIPQPTLFFASRLVADYGPLNESYHYALDYEWINRVSQHVKLTCVDDTLAVYRMHSESKTGDWYSTKSRFYAESERANRTHAPVWRPRSWPLWWAKLKYDIRASARQHHSTGQG
jgi:glycosyltransferase involved in cell wall biosynthesis/GT2 family glycosyltransferase